MSDENSDHAEFEALVNRLKRSSLLDDHRISFSNLPSETREFFAALRPEDIKEIKAAIEWQRTARLLGRVSYWVITTIAGITIATVTIGEKVQSVFGWLKH